MNETTNTPVTAEELNAFKAAVSDLHHNGLKAEYPTCKHNWGRIDLRPGGRKFAKLVTERPEYNGEEELVGYGQASAFCFIDLSTGDIFKADGWSRPAKHARGNIRRGDASNLWNGAFTNIGGGLHTAYLR